MKNYINTFILLALGLGFSGIQGMQQNNFMSNLYYDNIKAFETIYNKRYQLHTQDRTKLDILHGMLLAKKEADPYYKGILSAIYSSHSLTEHNSKDLLELSQKYIAESDDLAQKACPDQKKRQLIENIGPYCKSIGGFIGIVALPLAILNAYNQNIAASCFYTSLGLAGFGTASVPRLNNTWNTVLRAKGIQAILQDGQDNLNRINNKSGGIILRNIR